MRSKWNSFRYIFLFSMKDRTNVRKNVNKFVSDGVGMVSHERVTKRLSATQLNRVLQMSELFSCLISRRKVQNIDFSGGPPGEKQ